MWTIPVVALVAFAYPGQVASNLDCTFENETLCGYTVEIDHTPGLFDVMQWRWGEAVEKQKYYDIKLLAFGPDGDHTTGAPDGHFMYAVRPINPHTNTTLLSPPSSGRLCYVQMFYHMGSKSLNTMTLYIIKYGERIKLWSVDGSQGRSWNRMLVDIEKYTEFGDYQIAIEVNEPDDAYWTVGYALDDIKGIECNLPVDCNFEKDLCNWEVQSNTSVFDPMKWSRGKTRTKTWFGMTDTMRDGPQNDHTTGTSHGYFAYALKTLAGNTATGLVSPKQLEQMCHVTFWYYMNVTTLRTLEFHVRKDGMDFQVWNVSGNQGNQWNYVELDVETVAEKGSYELVFWAKEPVDSYWAVGYAIDDIRGYRCACENNPCKNGGGCMNRFNNYTCVCPKYFEGQSCEINTNPCRDYPCKNFATCNPVGDNYTCDCYPGYTGHDCDLDVDECASSPCAHGTCLNLYNSYYCWCEAGYEGDQCSTDIDECESTPCQNGANCTEGVNSYTCDCPPGFTGKQCEINIDECASSPCQHGGMCYDEINTYVCICPPDYAGVLCEVRNLMDCDFESDFCGYQVSTTDPSNDTDAFEWVRGPLSVPGFFGSSRILFMGPSVDHTTGETDGNATYAKRGNAKNATTTLLSPLMEGRLCYLEFFYHMGTGALNTLDVYMIKDGNRNLIFSSNGYQGFEWQRAMLDIEEYTETGRYQLSFEVNEPDDNGFLSVGYAIDDIKGFNCDLSLDCDFENDTCNYIIEREDNFFDRMEWRRGQAVLETIFSDIKLLRNGPSGDHTTGKPDGHFMYAVKPINSGTNTTLVAPRQRDQLCFIQFFYHMGSHFLNNLEVSVRAENETYMVFNTSGYKSDGWDKALINIEEETRVGKYEIAIFVDEPDDMFWSVGYAIDDITASPCLCANSPCMNNATCTNEYYSYTCTCPYLYSGRHCETRLTPCDYSPCAHGSACDNQPGDNYRCNCTEGWMGNDCEVEVDECESNPCMNGANCTDLFNGYECVCEPGWYGTHCEININECLSQPCQNGATCIDEVNFYQCECVPGYWGVYCQFDIQECDSNPCLNGATCVDDINFYSCKCPPGYSGDHCEINIDECASNPCLNDGMCYDRVNRFDCYCKPGYTGSSCARNVNECWSSPCLNGATCVDMVNDYQCSCAPGYTGTHCETDIDECASAPCRNGGTCHNEAGKFKCDCPITWAGEQCEKALGDCGTDPC
ncbi:fibropellin-1-like [Haliotis cracherodii]|uniref:fibropellin-1-like n=1 Tax=Haliotis cracherodii TaxID=6455 RepID=UPI0039E9A57B